MKATGRMLTRLLAIVPALVIAYFGLLFLTGSAGNPSMDVLGTGSAQEGAVDVQQQATPTAETLAQQAKGDELAKREEAVARKEQELAVLERDLLRMRREIAEERTTLEADKAEFDRQETERKGARILQIANTLKATKADVAAAQLIALYQQNRTTALYILSQIDARSAGKIFSKMTDAKLAATILEDLEAWRVAQSAVDTTSTR
jgi:flagellar motility protein MotE (MotC chaperone)